MDQVILFGSTSLLGGLFFAAYKYLFHRPSLKEYEHPYKEYGYLHGLWYVLFRTRDLLFRKYEKRFNDFDVNSEDSIRCGIYPTKAQIQLESPQSVKDSTDMDEVSFMGVNPKTGDVLNVSLANRKDDKCEAVISFIVNEGGIRKEYELPELPRTLSRGKREGGRCWACNDLKIWNLRSLCRWRISFNGLMREKTSQEISYVVFNIVWSTYTRVIDHKDDTSSAVRSRTFALSGANGIDTDLDNVLNQYDQWGTFCGSYTIEDGPETEILLFGSKNRRTGKLNHSDIHQLIQIQGYVEDGSSFSFNAINIPYRIPEMIWGYVELGSGYRHSLTSSDFDLLTFKDLQSSPKVLSTRFKTDDDEYILDISCENGDFTHVWGCDEELKAKCNNLTVCLTSMYHGVRLEGSGIIRVMSKNDLDLGSPRSFPPLLEEPDVDDQQQVASKSILDFSEDYCKSSKLVGGKGSSLAMLKQIKHDFEVPDGFCITVAANCRHIKENEKLKRKIERISQICCGKLKGNTEEECKSLGKLFEEADISKSFMEELRQKMVGQFGKNFEELPFGVRSSAIGEDGEEMSAAGQMETILGCKGLEQIEQGIKKCWASCFGFRAVEYRRQNGQPIDVGTGVVVQQMVAADKAGVLFTRDPVNGNPAAISIAANYGLGESVVSAMSEPDTIVVKRTFDNQLSLSQIIVGKKKLQVFLKETGGVEESEMPAQDTALCCLTEEEAMQLAKLGVLVEQCYGSPRDIEWAIHKGNIYLLQARPITNLHNENEYFLQNEFNSPCFHDSDCSTSGNIKEVFPGSQSVLSLSFVQPLFILIFLRMGYSFGINNPPNPHYSSGFTCSQHHYFNRRANTMYANNVKLKKGQTTTLHKMRKGIDIAFNGRVVDDKDLEKRSIIQYRYGTNYNILKQILHSTWMTFIARRKLDNAKKRYWNYEIDLGQCRTNEEILAKLCSLCDPYVNTIFGHGFATMASTSANCQILMTLLGEGSDFTESHYGDFALLMSIESGNDVESADVPSALQLLAKEIIDKSDYEKFLNMSDQEGVEFLKSDESPVKDCYRDFIKRHGHRCVKEFDIHSKTWAMEPAKLVTPLQAIIRTKDKLEKVKLTVDEAIGRLETPLADKQRKSLRKQVLKARKFVEMREEGKSTLIRTVDHYRKAWRKFGLKLVAEGRLPDDELLFFMTTEEIEELLKTRSAKVVQRAMKRKRLHSKLERLRFPEICFGVPKPISEEVPKLDEVDGSIVLKGIPVSRGVIEAPVRVVQLVEDAHIIQPGDILVTNATDIAWSPYFPSLSGVITEIGGLISHGAVVAREYGIPCVVGVANATVYLKSGDRIRLNGNDGSITVLK